jgi:hypothetical protein
VILSSVGLAEGDSVRPKERRDSGQNNLFRARLAPPGHKFNVYISGQRRRVTETIKRELGRCTVEPVIGHAKSEHHMGRNSLAGPTATPPTPSSPPATTSDACSNGWPFCCPRSSSRSPPRPVGRHRSNRHDSVLHGRLLKSDGFASNLYDPQANTRFRDIAGS